MNSNFDTTLFSWINHWPHNSLTDMVSSVSHGVTNGGILYYICIFFLLLLGKKLHRKIAFLWLISLLLTYSVTDVILKHLIQRPRPFMTLHNVVALYPLPHSFSFPSGEAAGAWATAVCLFMLVPKNKARYLLFVFAIYICIERIYMGHHYPSDVFVGAVVGAGIAYMVVKYQRGAMFLLKKIRTACKSKRP